MSDERDETNEGIEDDVPDGSTGAGASPVGEPKDGLGKVVGHTLSAAGRAARAAGQGIGTAGSRAWAGLTIGRARQAEARIEAARSAAKARAIEVAESVAPSPVKPDTATIPSSKVEPEAEVEEPEAEEPEEPEEPEAEVEEPEAEVVEPGAEVVEPGAEVEEPEAEVEEPEAEVEEPEAEVEEPEAEEPEEPEEPEAEVEEPEAEEPEEPEEPEAEAEEPEAEAEAEEPEAEAEEPEAEEPEEPEALTRPGLVGATRMQKVSSQFAGGLAVVVRSTRVALDQVGRALARWWAALSRLMAKVGRATVAGLLRFGRSLGPAWAIVSVALVAAGRATGHGLSRAGGFLVRIGSRTLQWIVRTAKTIGGGLGLWIQRIRTAWAAQPPRPRLWISVGAGVTVLLAYSLAQVAISTRVAPDTTVMGLDLGGMSSTEAREVLEARLIEASSTPIAISAYGEALELSPEELGLTIDIEATLDSLTGFSLSPMALWRQVAGAGPIEPKVIIHEATFERSIDEIASEFRQEALDATVTLGPTGASFVENQNAVDINDEELGEAVLASWPETAQVEAPITVTPPDLTTEEAERFANAVNGIVLGSPAVLSSPNGTVTLTPEDIAALGVVVTHESHFSLTVDGVALEGLVRERLPQVENAAIDASFAFDSAHMLVVVPGTPARTIDSTRLAEEGTLAVTSLSRTGDIPFLETPPAVTTFDLEESDFQEIVSTYRTEFTPREPNRERNIANAARLLTGQVVQPGEVLSITEAIGPIERANGYVSAGVIVGGVHTSGIGGGLCQIATTAYVVAYLNGYEILERRSHSEWFPRYPAGRDAAIAKGLDMQFRNDTPYALMFNAYVEDAGLTIDVWSTPYYTTEVSSSGKYNVTRGGYKLGTETPCYPSSSKDGFAITDTRTVYLDGNLIKTETFVSHYRAISGTRCA